ALGRVDRSNHAVELRPGPRPLLSKRRAIMADQLDCELPAHFSLPLLDERRRHQDEDRPDQTSDHQFGENQASLDGLAQANLIAQHGPAAKTAQDGLDGADLMLEQFELAD